MVAQAPLNPNALPLALAYRSRRWESLKTLYTPASTKEPPLPLVVLVSDKGVPVLQPVRQNQLEGRP